VAAVTDTVLFPARRHIMMVHEVRRQLVSSVSHFDAESLSRHVAVNKNIFLRVSFSKSFPEHACVDAAPTPTGFAEVVGDDFPVLHAQRVPARLLY
jgi:hypothetical protein